MEKLSKTNSREGRCWNSRGVRKTESFNSRRGWVLNCVFLSFFNHENYSVKNICVYSKSKIKTKVTSKQNLEHFKMINRRLFIPKFCKNSKMLLSFSWAIFIRALVFSSSPRANFFVSTNFSIHSYLLHKGKNKKQLYYHKDWQVSIMLYYLFWCNKTQLRSFLIQLETTIQLLWKFERKIICDEKFRRNIERVFCYCRDLKMSWLEHFPRFNRRWVWSKYVLGGKFSEK